MSAWRRRGLSALLVLALATLLAEAAHWRGARASAAPTAGDSCVVLVAGYPAASDGSPHPVQRLRVEAGVEAFETNRCEKLIVSGAAVHNAYVEADVMARLAEGLGVPANAIVLERRATSTWENIALSLPLLEGYEHILLVSDGIHVHRARRYLCRQRPDLCARTYAIGAYHPFELLWWKLPASLYELRALVRDELFSLPNAS